MARWIRRSWIGVLGSLALGAVVSCVVAAFGFVGLRALSLGVPAAASVSDGEKLTEIRGSDLPFHEVVERFVTRVADAREGEALDDLLRAHGIDPGSAAVPELRGLRDHIVRGHTRQVVDREPYPECRRVFELGRSLAEAHRRMVTEGSPLGWHDLLVEVDRHNRNSGVLLSSDTPELFRRRVQAAVACWEAGVRSVYPGEPTEP